MGEWMDKKSEKQLHTNIKGVIFAVLFFLNSYKNIPDMYETCLPKTFFITCTQSNFAISPDGT